MTTPYLTTDNVDDLGRMTLALLSELWIVRDRMAVMEQLMIERGALTAGEIDDYVPGVDLSATLDVLRTRMATAVVGAPIAAVERSVDQILARAGMARPTPATA